MLPRRSPKHPALGRVRLATPDDASSIVGMLTEAMSKTFRVMCTNDIAFLIHNCVLSICQLDVNHTIIGFLALRDYPLIPALHPMAWEEYFWMKYKAQEMNARNTLFIHMLCWNRLYNRDVVDSMLKSVFMHDAYVYHIALIKSRGAPFTQLVPGQSRAEASFRRVTVIERGVNGEMLPVLCVADRNEVCPRLRIRRAVEEDNDDIVPIIEQHSDRLRELYGDFYISELISRHPESERVLLVCEHKELAVGVMCLNTQINYDTLEDNFVLTPFAGLRHIESSPVPKNAKNDSTYSLLAEPHYTDSTFKTKDQTSRVTWVFEDDEFKDYRSEKSSSPSKLVPNMPPEVVEQQLRILDLFDDEDVEDFEFDIVNIDFNLLTPEIRSTDTFVESPADTIQKMINERKYSEAPSTFDEKARKKRSISGSGAVFKIQEPVQFTGTPNAFQLELFAIHPNYDERYGYDMLEAAYEMFPGRDYCVLCLPSNHSSFPLLEHFTLVTPLHCNMRFINESLYVAHVNSVRGKLSVRPGEAYDVNAVREVLENAPHVDTLVELFQSTLVSDTLQSFILMSENQPIGMAIVGPLEEGTTVRTQYDLDAEPRRPGTDGSILAGVLSPAFEPHARWYMRELLRYSRYNTLFWICRLFARGDAIASRNLMSLAGHMNPVHPRQSVPNISGNKNLDKIFKDLASPFALWVLERPLTSVPKIYVNNSIVVVGASRTGLAFLETLLMGPTSQYLTFSNITLVSEHGLPTVADCLKAADICVPRDGRYTDRYIKSVPFYYYVDVMSAVMVKIDRKRKCIYLRGGGSKYYDELVLTCGHQFQHPDYLKESLGLAKEVTKGKPCERILMDNPKYRPDVVPMPPDMPENVFLINSLYEANIYLRKLMWMINDTNREFGEPLSKKNQVVVYGDCIEAYSCMAALLELGIAPELIVFVEPFPSTEEPSPPKVNCFNDETVDARVQATVQKLGIRVLRQSHLAAWHQMGRLVESLDFMTPLTSISVKCFAFFYYGLQAINLHAFKAINESGLVYDGGVVVNPTFETNDPSIYAAGTCVRYSRRLYANRSLHRDYCSEDIGEALAKLFLHKLDPFMVGDTLNNADDLFPRYSSATMCATLNTPRLSAASIFRKWQPVMKFESPIVQSATLPGPLYYMKVRKPGKEVPMAVQQCLPRQGHTLITDKKDNYFRLNLNVLHVVDAVTCLSHKPFSSEILSQLYGKHEAFFNRLYSRFKKKQIDDFYEFFTQPWMSAIYQETFKDLMEDIHLQDVGMIFDLVQSKFKPFDEMEDSQKKAPAARTTRSPSISSTSSYIREPRRVGNVRSVIEKYVAENNDKCTPQDSYKCCDIPSECGQSKAVRLEASKYWKKIGGDRIVMAHLAKYLEANVVTNPHFVRPQPDCV